MLAKPTIGQLYFENCLAEGKPYFGSIMHAVQGSSIRHGYMNRLVEVVDKAGTNQIVKILEIGSWAGGSAVTWAHALKKYHNGKGVIVCVDSWKPYYDPNAYSHLNSSIYHSMDQALTSGEIFNLFLHNIKATGNEDCILPMIGSSENLLPLLAEASFDIVFVDGAHDYENTRNDLLNASRLVVEGGVLCGDDLELQRSEVDLSYAEANRDLDYICDPRTGIWYHPGVSLAVGEISCPASSWEGFWALRKEKKRFVSFSSDLFAGKEIVIPPHLAHADIFSPNLLINGYKGFNLVKYLDSFYAIAQSLGPVDLNTISIAEIDVLSGTGFIVTANTLEVLKQEVDKTSK